MLDLRDAIKGRLVTHGRPAPSTLTDWRVLTVLRAIQTELDSHKPAMPRELREAYEASWSSFTGQIRIARNDAGHPSSVDPVTPETVHAALLIFPELAGLASKLKTWVESQMP